MTGPTPFDKLLAWLDPDRDEAARKYQRIHSRLISIFSSHGCSDPAHLGDETMDRVMSKIDWLVENYEGEPMKYFYGVARFILLEDMKTRVTQDTPVEQNKAVDNDDDEGGPEYDCLDKCMAKLPPNNQSLVLEYYEGERQAKILHRRKLAEELGISLSVLRLRVFHIREQLGKCLKICLDGHSAV